MHKLPFVIYSDTECYLERKNNKISVKINQIQKYKLSGYCYFVKFFDDNLHPPILKAYTKKEPKKDVALKFVKSLEKTIRKIYKKFKFPKKIIFTEKDEKDFNDAKKCYACEKEFLEENEKVKDHCHFPVKYRGAACISCNSQMKKPNFTPVIFHNLQNYDSHLFIKKLGVTEGDISCIPKTDEKYISFSKKINVYDFIKEGEIINVKKYLRFIDSFKFMSTSLEKMVKNLGKEKLYCLKKYFKNEKEIELLSRKGVFPYQWYTCLEKLNATSPTSKDEFYSELNEEGISDEDYQYVLDVWNKLGIKNMREYHDLYLKTDVLLLADAFESFRELCMRIYKLDPAWYFSSPGLA